MKPSLLINDTDAINILNTITNAVMVMDELGVVLYANPAAHSLLGQENLVGKNCGLPVLNDSETIDVHLVRKGELGWAQLRSMPIQWAGEIANVVMLTDITDLKSAQRQSSKSEACLQAIFDNLPFLIWMKDTKSHYVQVNKSWLESAKVHSLNEAIGKTDFDFWPKDIAEHYQNTDNEVLQTRQQRKLVEMAIHKGKETWFETMKVPIIDDCNQILGTIGLARDVTQEREVEEKLKLAASIYENSSEGMLITNQHNQIISVNSAFTQITGYSEQEVFGKNPKILSSGSASKSFYDDMWHSIKTTGYWKGEVCDKKKNGELHIKKMRISTIPDSTGNAYRYVGLFSDITDMKNNEATIWHQANYDSLTELPNRRLFFDRLDKEILKVSQSGDAIAVLLVDLDNFKEINDTLGHYTGDVLLIEAAKRIVDSVNEVDTVSRLGGDEFIVMLTDFGNHNSYVEYVAQKILLCLQKPIAIANELFFISGSIGITLYPNDASTSEELVKNADQAMYVSKNNGRNQFSYFTSTMQEHAQKRLKLISDLRCAIKDNQFRLFYQPIIDLSTGKIHKAEALIRWIHPTRGIVSPADFIPLAEETGLIVEMGDWIFKEAANFAKYLSKKTNQKFQISVNKSPVQFYKNEESDDWISYLNEIGLDCNQIVVEITEGLLLNSDSSVKNRLLEYRDVGIEVAIDDFGTGYSSLAYLNKFDIDYLKIDQSFTRNLQTSVSEMAIVEAIIEMAHKLGLKVIAEGVETENQHNLLFAAGCDFGQGYLYSRPIPSEEFEKLICNSLISH